VKTKEIFGLPQPHNTALSLECSPFSTLEAWFIFEESHPRAICAELLCAGHREYVNPQSGAVKGSERPWDPPLTERGKL
jgi:hypothetical protein